MVAKVRDGPYMPGERAMMKVKQHRTAECVVGGFRYRSGSNEVGSLLLGLFDTQGQLDHVGFTATIANKDRAALTAKLEALIAPPGFTGKAPGGPSRWSTARSEQWQPLKPKLVVEVSTARSPATASATAPSSCASVPTSALANARSNRSSRRRSQQSSSPAC